MRVLIVTLALLAAACTPPAQQGQPAETPNAGSTGVNEAPDPERDAMLAALNPRASQEIGIPVAITVTTKRTDGDWGWIVGQPWTPEGTQIDWSATRYATEAREGVLDGGGTTYALLRRQNGTWSVVDIVVGPTDVAWDDWSVRHGAPDALMRGD